MSLDEVIGHYPPKYLIGETTENEKEIMSTSNEMVDVRLVQVECNYIYSNPTGLFNLSLP